jgi:hypothetical protein
VSIAHPNFSPVNLHVLNCTNFACLEHFTFTVAMASNSEVACDWDSVNTVTVDVATGPVLYHLGRALRDEVRRLRLLVLHKEAAQWETTDVAEGKS